jgi:hypothetical protein
LYLNMVAELEQKGKRMIGAALVPNTPEECLRAIRLVASRAYDAADARLLLDILGLKVERREPVHLMEKGKWYKVRHRAEGQRYDRKSVVRYLGVEAASIDRGPVEHLFDARPTAGTQTLPDNEISSVEEVPKPDQPVVAARWKDIK